MSDRISILCTQLPLFAPARWEAVRAAFAGVPSSELVQAWRGATEERFQPGCVRAGWEEDAIWVFAELSDAAIMSVANGFNEPAFLTGDVFEIFLRPQGQAPYFEFHVTPFNGRLQLRYPDAASVDRVRQGIAAGESDPFKPFKVTAELFQSWTRIEERAHRWEALVRIPVESVAEGLGPPATRASRASSRARETRRAGGDIPVRFDCSFCRYDYTPGIASPVISSSSPHREPNFHRSEEWAELTLV